ncbi:MAG: bifunctional nuclease family protein [Actinomycetota bacterium]
MLIEMNLAGVRIELPSNQPIVLLRETGGARYLPIWIGQPEAAAIAMVLQGVTSPRPMTHDLLRDVLEALGVAVTNVSITELRDGTFYAVIGMTRDGSAHEVSARPSDAIALAVRLGCKILVADEVLSEASILLPDGEGEGETPEVNEEVERFREFLEEIEPEDFS